MLKMMGKYCILGYSFSSQNDVSNAVRKILYRFNEDTKLNEKEKDFMIEFFAMFHCRWQDKKGVGISHIWRRRAIGSNKNRAFFIERIDGTSTDISFNISKIKKDDALRDFKSALRSIIYPQIIDFRNKAFAQNDTIFCPIIGIEVSIDNCHVDHFHPTFKVIVKDFISSFGIEISPSLIKKSRDWSIKKELVSDHLAKLFYDYHKENAVLRVTSSKGNLTRGK